MPKDTAEYLLGDVHVTTVLLESSTVLNANNDNSENWDATGIADVKQKVTDGLQWWKDSLAQITDKHELNFDVDFTFADRPFITNHEPIKGPSTNHRLWVKDFLTHRGFNTGDLENDIRAFNHSQRLANNSNWAFTIFVVNDENDIDHQFAPGGLSRAFAFAGGQFLVTLASRPSSTIAHEAGHIFWALDEYQSVGQFDRFRGYYDTQNSNAWNNPVFTQGQQREISIMDKGACDEGGGLLCAAFQQHTSSQSSLEMIGWKDSDGDGVFDVLDVPLSLDGTGYFDEANGEFHFVGTSSVQTLPNLNPPQPDNSSAESLQNDITINKVSRAQFRVDEGAWSTAAVYDTYTADLDLRIPVPSSASTVEIRTLDDTTRVTSPIFTGLLSRPTSVLQQGINGFVFDDADGSGTFDPGESGIAGHTVRLVDDAGSPVSLAINVDADNFAADSDISDAVVGVSLSPLGTAFDSVRDGIYARSTTSASTGSRGFAVCSKSTNGSCTIYATEWTAETRQLRIDFADPVTSVAIDAISNSPAEYGRLEIYDANDNLLARHTSAALSSGQVETMELGRPTADIAYAIARGHAGTAVVLDNLRVGPAAATVTDDAGAFLLPHLAGGHYHVQVSGLDGSTATTATFQTVELAEGETRSSVDFGFHVATSPWHNAELPGDVSDDGIVSPLDALQIVNDLNANGSRALPEEASPPPFVDVNNDGLVTPLDVLLVVNAINGLSAEGEVAASPVVAFASAGSNSQAEGEALPLVARPLTRQALLASNLDDQAAVPEQKSEGESAPRTSVAADAPVPAGVDNHATFGWVPLLEDGDFDSLLQDLAQDVASSLS